MRARLATASITAASGSPDRQLVEGHSGGIEAGFFVLSIVSLRGSAR